MARITTVESNGARIRHLEQPQLIEAKLILLGNGLPAKDIIPLLEERDYFVGEACSRRFGDKLPVEITVQESVSVLTMITIYRGCDGKIVEVRKVMNSALRHLEDPRGENYTTRELDEALLAALRRHQATSNTVR